jgi:cytochrome c-type biogenesis protein CcmE
MTVAPPSAPMLPLPRRPWAVVVLVVVVLAVIGYLAFSSVGTALVYYLTPTELLARGDAAIGETVRLGGQVAVGSVSGPATDLHFRLADREHEIPVHSTVAPTRSFREGAGAVVEGALDAGGVFQATRVIVKHDENYEAPAPGAQPSDRAFTPGDEPGEAP